MTPLRWAWAITGTAAAVVSALAWWLLWGLPTWDGAVSLEHLVLGCRVVLWGAVALWVAMPLTVVAIVLGTIVVSRAARGGWHVATAVGGGILAGVAALLGTALAVAMTLFGHPFAPSAVATAPDGRQALVTFEQYTADHASVHLKLWRHREGSTWENIGETTADPRLAPCTLSSPQGGRRTLTCGSTSDDIALP